MQPAPNSPLPLARPDHWANLLWALSCGDINQTPSLPWLPAARRQRLHGYFSTADAREQLGALLLRAIDSSSNRRLGIYFENLLAFALEYHPDYQLIARNLPLRHQGKTLGELDFVVRYLPEDTVEHWELAVKFYLQVGDFWVGPGLKDRLDIKLARTRDHQLPIIHHPLAQAQLQKQGIPIQRQWTLMPGRLFSPLPCTRLQSTAGAVDASGPWWTDLPSFLATFDDSDWHWWQLPKPAWLAPLGPTQLTDGDQALSTRAIADRSDTLQAQLQARGPFCVAAGNTRGELSRGFIVPDDWHARAAATNG